MANSDYYTLTNLAALFVGQTRNSVGKALKELGFRGLSGKPTPLAYSLRLVDSIDGPQPWIKVFVWHRERIIPFLEQWGTKQKETETKESEVTT